MNKKYRLGDKELWGIEGLEEQDYIPRQIW